MNVLVATVAGSYTIDPDPVVIDPVECAVADTPPPALNPPRVVAAAAAGSTVVAIVDAKPPLLVSHDTGATWRESGRGLPPGRAIAISEDDPDLFAYASRNRLYVSHNGGVFWTALAVELPEIERVAV